MKNIVIFASGNGSNAQRIIDFFKDNENIQISNIFCNNQQAFVIERAKSENIPLQLFNKEDLYTNDIIKQELELLQPDLIVLAGFLWLFPKNIIQLFPKKIINLHPALLPNYGGKGMYGDKVHQSVIANKDTQSGITIHYINEEYDKGDIILQAKCEVKSDDTPETLAKRIHKLEHEHLPLVIQKLLV